MFHTLKKTKQNKTTPKKVKLVGGQLCRNLRFNNAMTCYVSMQVPNYYYYFFFFPLTAKKGSQGVPDGARPESKSL